MSTAKARPIRILHVMPQIGIGGAETQLYELITRSSPDGMVHRVLCYSDSLEPEGLRLYKGGGIHLERVPRDKRHPIRFVRAMAEPMVAWTPDIVHCWLASGIIWGRLAALWAGIPRIIVAHRGINLPGVRLLRVLEKITGHRVVYAANSRAGARAVGEQLGVPAEHFNIVYNGVDVDRYGVGVGAAPIRQELRVPAKAKLVVTVGRLTPEKDYPMLLEVAHRCRDLPLRFIIVGYGELREQLLALSTRLGVNDSVHFLDLRRDVPQILRAADLFCFTSRHEGFPNAILEAMASGLPIATTRFPSAEEVIEDGRSGLIVPAGDAEGMARALSKLLNHPAYAAGLARSARQQAEERFAMPRMVEETRRMYEGVLAGEKVVRSPGKPLSAAR
jgi:glycosyltransferase involved in cell wall biosynthesis